MNLGKCVGDQAGDVIEGIGEVEYLAEGGRTILRCDELYGDLALHAS